MKLILVYLVVVLGLSACVSDNKPVIKTQEEVGDTLVFYRKDGSVLKKRVFKDTLLENGEVQRLWHGLVLHIIQMGF